MTYTVRYGLLLIVLFTASHPSWAADATAENTGGEAAVTLSVNRNVLVVPVRLNDQGPFPFILDPAMPNAVISTGIPGRLGLPQTPKVTIEQFQLGAALTKPVECDVADLSQFAQLLGEPVAGVFSGREVCNEIHLDFERSTAYFRSGAAEELSADKPDVPMAVPMTLQASAPPLVMAVLNGQHLRSVGLDFTFAGTMAVPESLLAETSPADNPPKRIEADPLPVPGPVPPGTTQARLQRVAVGATEVREPVCAVVDDTQPPCVGLGFLQRCAVTLNYPSQRVRLSPVNEAPVSDPPLIGVGVTPAQCVAGHWSVWVAKDSPAARAGLVSGAMLDSVNDRPVDGLPYAECFRILSGAEGNHVRIKAVQGDDSITVDLAAERLL